jgi:hypothetical protein
MDERAWPQLRTLVCAALLAKAHPGWVTVKTDEVGEH